MRGRGVGGGTKDGARRLQGGGPPSLRALLDALGPARLGDRCRGVRVPLHRHPPPRLLAFCATVSRAAPSPAPAAASATADSYAMYLSQIPSAA
mmetsp:Transcript_26198/g.78217  ORF Transcript_26198/g.78217 Transcript_26198/m.78217 type:complete len:94 (+) Transcript_26198:519-800(+)